MSHTKRRASYYVTVAIALPVLIGFTAMGTDWGAYALARNHVQTAADTAALAAASSMGNHATGRMRARAYADAVVINGRHAVVTDADVEYGYWDGAAFHVDANEDGKADDLPTKSSNCVKTIASVDVDLPFTGVFRRLLGDTQGHTVTVRQVAGASPNATPGRAPDTILALDVTGSMNTTELNDISIASRELINCVQNHATGSSRAAVAKFTGVVHVTLGLTDYGTGYARLRNATGRSGATVPPGIRGCGVGADPACSGTNQAAGLAGARYILENALTPEGVGQAVVLFSDGAPNEDAICTAANYANTAIKWNAVAPTMRERCEARRHCNGGSTAFYRTKAHIGNPTSSAMCTSGGHAGHGHTWTATLSSTPFNHDHDPVDTYGDIYFDWAMNERALLMNEGVNIFTVYYSQDTGGEGLMQALASTPGKYFEAPASEDIAGIFTEICIATATGDPGLLF